jgi:mannose-6-phosphate isomerase-like protein (cupin superfamily)
LPEVRFRWKSVFICVYLWFQKGHSMDVKELERQLQAEGFRRTYSWQDGPGAFYPDHTHAMETAHIILDGEMTLMQAGETRTYRAGDRVDVPAGAVHSAKMGPAGCRYLIGER